MTVVHPNHIVGINSITVQTGDSLSVHKADGSLIRTIVSNTGVSTFHAIEVSKGGGDLTVGVSTFFVDNSTGKIGIGTVVPAGLLEIDAASTTEMIMLDVAGVNFAKIGHNAASGVNVLDVRSEGHVRVLTGGNNERLRLDSSGRLIIGHTATDDRDGYNSALQVSGTGGDDSSASIGRWSANTSAPGLAFSKSRNGTIGSHTVVAANDVLGMVQFQGDDGTNYHVGADIRAKVVSGVGNDDMPADLIFSTNAGSTGTTQRLLIASDGKIIMGNSTTSTTQLDIRFTETTAYSATSNHVNGLKIFNDTATDGGFAGIELAATDGQDYYGSTLLKSIADGANYTNDFVIQTRVAGNYAERFRIDSNGAIDLKVAATEADIYHTGSGDRWPLRLLNSDTTSGNMTGIYFGPCNNVAGAYISGKAEADFTSTANRDAGLEFGTRLDGNWKESMKISAAGYPTFPYLPAFSAKSSASTDFTSGAQVLYPNEDFDRNGDYTAASSYFTAPIAGIYFVSWSVKGTGSSNTTVYANCQVSTNDGGSWNQRGPALEFSSDVSSEHTGMAAIINLGADDRVRIGSATNVRVDASDHFAMCLIG